jgi:murein DD-endopeptidase MepM/ murein hydrolase activator NlpD
MTTRRSLCIALTAAALYAGVLVSAASAELHRVRVTLVTGQQLTLTVDVPPGTPVSQVQIPGLPAPVQSILDLGTVSTATPTATPTAPATVTPTVTSTTTPTPTPTPTRTPANRTSGSSDGQTSSGGGNTADTVHKQASRTADKVKRHTNVESVTGKVEQPVRKTTHHHATAPPSHGSSDGAPTPADPTYTLATPGPARIGVPNFFIDKFRIPPFLLPIYQAAGTQYGVRWELLAAINEIETDYGRNLSRSSAGAVGWMQFLPGTWKLYGVDANGDGKKDPYNPVDAIFSAARYLRAAGAGQDLRGAVFAYNHADWYVDSVLLRARLIAGLPPNLVGSLTGLTEGRFPVAAKATYADDLSARELRRKRVGNRALVVSGSAHRHGINIFSRAGAAVVAVNDAKVVRIGRSLRLGRFIQVQDVYGNTYTYARLAKVAKRYAEPKPQRVTPGQIRHELALPQVDPKPTAPASDTTRPAPKVASKPATKRARASLPTKARLRARSAPPTKVRLFAHPERPNAARAGGDQQLFQRTGRIDGGQYSNVLGLPRDQIRVRKLHRGSQIPAGTVLGRIGHTSSRLSPHMLFEIRPAGRGAPRVDPKPILDGWKLLESTAIYRAKGKNPFFGPDAQTPSVGQILLMSKDTLARRVLSDPRIQIYSCGRRDIQAGRIDRRVLATLEFLVASGFDPTVTALECGHSYLTASGNVSEHSSGNAVDIAEVNGIPILGHQGPGSITDMVIRRLLTLQGTMKPHQIISLMTFPGTDNTLSLPDHADHIHVGFRPLYGTNPKLARRVNAILKPKQWIKLIDRLGQIDNPKVSTRPSKYALKDKRGD